MANEAGENGLTLYADPALNRTCGGCKSCCTIVPVEFETSTKPANVRCSQLRSFGCRIYASRPKTCEYWSCRWLIDPNTAALRRPDHSHYIIDPWPDEIRLTDDQTGEQTTLPVLQIWCDPAFPDAWRDPNLQTYMRLMAKTHGMAAIIRWGSHKALTVFAPELTDSDQWHEKLGIMSEDIGLYGANKSRRALEQESMQLIAATLEQIK